MFQLSHTHTTFSSVVIFSATPQVRWRIFFAFSFAFDRLDASWTAALVSGRYITGRFPELLAQAESQVCATDSPEYRQERDLEREALAGASLAANVKCAEVAKRLVRKKRQALGNQLETVTEALADRELQKLGRVLNANIIPLRELYLEEIETFKLSPLKVAQNHARRVNNEWLCEFRKIIANLADADLARRCGILDRRALGKEEADAKRANGEYMDLLALRAANLVRVTLAAAAQYAWYMLPLSVCPPNSFAIVLHPSATPAATGLKKIGSLWGAVTRLSKLARISPDKKQLFSDLYWSGNPLVHESMLICSRRLWDFRNTEVRAMAFEQWAGLCDTQRVLESVFAVLRKSAAQSINRKMARYRAYFEAAHAKVLTLPSADEEFAPKALQMTEDDWAAPLVAPVSRMGEGMFVTPSAHRVPCLDLDEFQRGPEKAEIPWRPAGPLALMRMGAATEYTRLEEATEWPHCAAAWAGALLTNGCVFFDGGTDTCFVSMGFVKWVCLGLPCVAEFYGGVRYIWPCQGPACTVSVLRNHDCTQTSPYKGLRVEVLAPCQSPVELAGHGVVVWAQDGLAMDLVPHAILNKCFMNKFTLAAACRAYKINVRRLPGEKSVTKAAHAVALVQHFFADEPWETQCELVQGISSAGAGRSTLGDANLYARVREGLDPSDEKDFGQVFANSGADEASDADSASDVDEPDTAEVASGSRQGLATQECEAEAVKSAGGEAKDRARPRSYPHGIQKNYTPKAVKDLVPGRCLTLGIYLVWRQTIRQWEAHYMGALPKASRSQTWDGPVARLSELEALTHVIDWLWLCHKRAGHQPLVSQPRPGPLDIEEALATLHVEGEACALARSSAASTQESTSLQPPADSRPQGSGSLQAPACSAAASSSRASSAAPVVGELVEDRRKKRVPGPAVGGAPRKRRQAAALAGRPAGNARGADTLAAAGSSEVSHLTVDDVAEALGLDSAPSHFRDAAPLALRCPDEGLDQGPPPDGGALGPGEGADHNLVERTAPNSIAEEGPSPDAVAHGAGDGVGHNIAEESISNEVIEEAPPSDSVALGPGDGVDESLVAETIAFLAGRGPRGVCRARAPRGKASGRARGSRSSLGRG